MLAATTGDDLLLHTLADRGANLRAVDREGNTALIWSARGRGTREVVRILLGAGVDPFQRDHRQTDALTWAARLGNLAVLKALLEDPNVRTKAQAFPWAAALAKKDSDYGYRTPDRSYLLFAARVGEVTPDETLRQMVLAGADPKRIGPWGDTALHAAATGGAESRTFQLLLDRGAPPNAVEHQGQSPLMLAAGAGRDDLVELLLAHGANPRLRDRDGNSALYYAGKAPDQTLAARRRRNRAITLLRKAGITEP